MPRRPRRTALAVAVALLVQVGLAGCVASSTVPPQATPRPTATIVPADLRAAGGRVVDDERSSSLVIVPKTSNGGLVVFLHGWGQTRWSLLSRREEASVAHAIGDAGFTVLAADADGKAWGDPASLADYRSLIERTQARYRLHDVFLMGESMGGLATMQLARTLPDVRAATAWFPVCDIRTMREPRFQATIRDAWRGRSRAPISPVRVGDTPLMVWASPADTVVTAATNAAVCVAEAKAAGASVTYIQTSGEHGDPSNYDPAAVVRFFEKHRTPGA
ncbi:alpha/beta hydrolase family protein [Amnibacterium kyonggiense]|uniref:alpha/beta hydrolase family protein n=1 Tax=Amnibacterium kyonggiense TaxID=595671 RepID=UPI0013C2C5FA|nr:alpha/beta fold hydrolase [Amnibacterium kyonggiense]